MKGYLLQRASMSLLQIWVVATVLFLFIHFLPGDPAHAILGASDMNQPTPEQLETVRRELGLDRPLYVQYGSFLSGLLQGDLGTSFQTGRPVALDVGLRFGRTVQLVIPAILLSTLIGVTLGVVAAQVRGSWLDASLSALALTGHSVPIFVVGNLLVLALAIQTDLLPSSGYIEFSQNPKKALLYMIMPVFALALGRIGSTMRMTRTSVVEQLAMDYVRTARAKGLKERVVVYKHVLKNALIPVVTVVGLQLGVMFAGSVLVEAIFNWPGLNSLLLKSIASRDYPLIQGSVFFTSTIFVIVNLLTDISYAYLNPRLRYD